MFVGKPKIMSLFDRSQKRSKYVAYLGPRRRPTLHNITVSRNVNVLRDIELRRKVVEDP